MEQRWIPVSERLPEESLNSVIGWDTYRERCCFVQYTGGRFILGDDTDSVNIIAWRTLPEPYRAGKPKQTNADRIRSMTDEELALHMLCPNEMVLAKIECEKNERRNCYKCRLNWLRAEREG